MVWRVLKRPMTAVEGWTWSIVLFATLANKAMNLIMVATLCRGAEYKNKIWKQYY